MNMSQFSLLYVYCMFMAQVGVPMRDRVESTAGCQLFASLALCLTALRQDLSVN